MLLCNCGSYPSSFISIKNWVLYLKSTIRNSTYVCTLAQSMKTLTYPPQFSPTYTACFGHNMLTELSLCWFSWVIHLNGPTTQSAVATQSIYCLKQNSSYIQSVAEEAFVIKQKMSVKLMNLYMQITLSINSINFSGTKKKKEKRIKTLFMSGKNSGWRRISFHFRWKCARICLHMTIQDSEKYPT